jgi:hypothetical protein
MLMLLNNTYTRNKQTWKKRTQSMELTFPFEYSGIQSWWMLVAEHAVSTFSVMWVGWGCNHTACTNSTPGEIGFHEKFCIIFDNTDCNLYEGMTTISSTVQQFILLGDRVTIDGVCIGNRIGHFNTQLLTTLYKVTTTYRLEFSVTVFTALLSSGFQW